MALALTLRPPSPMRIPVSVSSQPVPSMARPGGLVRTLGSPSHRAVRLMTSPCWRAVVRFILYDYGHRPQFLPPINNKTQNLGGYVLGIDTAYISSWSAGGGCSSSSTHCLLWVSVVHPLADGSLVLILCPLSAVNSQVTVHLGPWRLLRLK